MQSEFEQEYLEATRRGEERLRYEPRAVTVRYNRRTRRVVIDLNNGCTLLVPPEQAQGLDAATPAELSDVRLLGPGTTIAWPQLDVQFSITGLLAGSLGTRQWMAKAGSTGRRVKSVRRSRGVPAEDSRGGWRKKKPLKGGK
jgi:hypothetical protein